jgi:hypothetical protein
LIIALRQDSPDVKSKDFRLSITGFATKAQSHEVKIHQGLGAFVPLWQEFKIENQLRPISVRRYS